jgi:hypothetical protein
VHLAMHANDAVSLDPARYVLSLADQFSARDVFTGEELCLRHYVLPVRYRFWLRALAEERSSLRATSRTP